MNKKGFTLVEIIIAMVILGVLTALVSGQFFNSLKKGRDARRKADLENIQKALELYFEDNRGYPPSASVTSGSALTNPGGTRTYMQKVPNDPNSGSGGAYKYCVDSTNMQYQLYAKLENSNDRAIITPAPILGCSSSCGSTCYGVSSPNVSP